MRASGCCSQKDSTRCSHDTGESRMPLPRGWRPLASSSTAVTATALPTVSAALPPAGLDVTSFRRILRERYGVVIAGGLGKMEGRLIRVGHLGAVGEGDILHVLWAIEQCLELHDPRGEEGRSLQAAAAVLAKSQVMPSGHT